MFQFGNDVGFAHNSANLVTFTRTITQQSDDAEEDSTGGGTGNVNLASSDLEMEDDGGTLQVVGMRFQNIVVPKGAYITNAEIQFTSDIDGTAFINPVNIIFVGEDADNPVNVLE